MSQKNLLDSALSNPHAYRRCPECRSMVIYAPDGFLGGDLSGRGNPGAESNGSFGSGEVVCSRCGLVLGRWHTAAVKVSHKRYIRNWKPKCHFCPRRTVRALRLQSYTYVCDKCLGRITSARRDFAGSGENASQPIMLFNPPQ